MLFIEYDVDPDGQVELVALVNAIEEDGQDRDGEAWMSWRRMTFSDAGLGCVGVVPDDLSMLESADDPAELRAIIERIIMTDRAAKERVTS